MTEQLQLDFDAAGSAGWGVEDPLADLDLDRAREVLEAEKAATVPPPTCRCRRRSGFLIDEYGFMRCTKCGRAW